MRKGLLFFAALLLLLLIGLTWLLTTSSGLRTAVSVAERFVSGLVIEQAEGQLTGPLVIKNLQYNADSETSVSIDDMQLNWAPSALLTARLKIVKLHINGVTIASQAEQEASDSETTLPEINLPVAIELSDFQLDDVQLLDKEGQSSNVIESLQAALVLQHDQVSIKTIQLDRPDVSASLSGNITMHGAYPVVLDYELSLKQLFTEPFKLNGKVSGDMDKLQIRQRTEEPLASTQQLNVQDVLKELRWSLTAEADKLDLAAIVPEQATRFDGIQLSASGDLNSLSAQLKTQVQQPELPLLAVATDVESLDLKNWHIAAKATHQQSAVSMVGEVSMENAEPQFNVQASWQNLGWPLEVENPEFVSPDGKLSLMGTLNAYKATLSTALTWAQQPLQLDASTHGSTTALTIEALTLNGFGGAMEANGELDWQTQPLQYLVNANWQDIALPPSLAGKAVAFQQGEIQLDGNLEQLTLATKTTFTIDGVNATLDATGQGETASGFEQTDVVIGLADGKVSYDGPLRWLGDTLLDGKLTIKELNPGVLVQGWPGNLSGQSAIKLSKADPTLQVNARDIAIRGELRQRPLSVTGSLSYRDDLVDIRQLEVNSGQSSLIANGQLQNDKLTFTWSLNSPDLQDFYPDISGSMTANGDISGTVKQPEVNAVMQAKMFSYQDLKVGRLDSKTTLRLHDNARISASLQLENIESPQLSAEQASLNIDGSQQAHAISLALNSKPIQLAVKANGALSNDHVWEGSFQEFDFENAKAGSWTLTEKGAVRLSQNQQTLPRHCWSSKNGQICLQATQAEGQWQTSGEFARLPLSLFEGFAVELEQLTGSLRGKFNLASGDDSVIHGSGDVYVDEASLQLNQSALNQKQPLQLNNVSLSYQLDETQTTAKFHIEPALDGVSAINANVDTVALQQLINNPEQAALKGQITTAVKDLSPLQLSHPAFDDMKGQLDINLGLSGTVAQPQIEGVASLQQGQVAIVDAGILLKDIQAKLTGNLDQVDFDLQARSGEGVLTGEGQFRLTENSWELETGIKGRQLEVMNTPEALVIAEPDLTITVTPALTLVRGKVHIPEAELEPTEFNSAVSPSRDVIVVSDKADSQSEAVTKVDVTVTFGDKIKLKAMGFQGRLTGGLRVFGKTSDILLANGEINIKDGTYLAYGQLLHVDDGSIRFAGGAVDNPELDIKAVRKGKDYQAGLHIQGFASAPQANLFSDPDMGQDDVLSYILLGKPLAQASATDAALLASAATGMGLQNGAMIGDQIASTFGLDEFSIGGDSAENAALQVGKYLSPKLYLSYGIGVFESVSTVELRYELSKIWALKAESGTESGVDLLYTYERGKPENRQ